MDSFAVLEPTADGFRNYVRNGHKRPAEELLVDRAHMLTLTAPEMTVLVGGLRVLNASVGQSKLGVFTNRPETLTNDFFVNLLDMNTKWQVSSKCEHVFEGRNRAGRTSSSAPAPPSTSSLVRTPSFEPSRKSMHVTTRSRCWCVTLWLRGTR